MAAFKYFSDTAEGTIEVRHPFGLDNAKFAAQFPGVKGLRFDGYTMRVGYPLTGTGGPLPITRQIEYKAWPSKHECNAKCLGGKATGTCECQCGGKNHGRGMFTSLVAA